MSRPVAAGKLRHRVTIEENRPEQDSDGNTEDNWVPWAIGVPAQIVALSARELISAAAVQSQITTRIVLRYRSGLRASMRINHRGAIYNIEGPIPDPDSGIRFVTLPCSSGVNQG